MLILKCLVNVTDTGKDASALADEVGLLLILNFLAIVYFLFSSKTVLWQAGETQHSECYDQRLFAPNSCSCFLGSVGRCF